MIPVSILYDEYIDRRKLTEKKPIWVYSSSPLKRVGTIRLFLYWLYSLLHLNVLLILNESSFNLFDGKSTLKMTPAANQQRK